MKILITGASGKLGCYLLRESQGLDVVGLSRTPPPSCAHPWVEADLGQSPPLDSINPDVVLHTAALSAISDCLQDPNQADRVNHQVAATLANWCDRNHRRMIYVSTDMVFDGEQAPYREDAAPQPLSEYGRSKWSGEKAVLQYQGRQGSFLVARVALMVGPALGSGKAFYDFMVEQLRLGRELALFEDEWRGMISYEDVARALLGLCASSAEGIVHLGGPRLSRWELGQLVAARLQVPQLIQVARRADHSAPEPRPRDLTLEDTRLRALLPDWHPRTVAEQLPAWLP